jgi:hypothetical protein
LDETEGSIRDDRQLQRADEFSFSIAVPLLPLSCAAGNQYLYHMQPYGIQFAWWTTTTATIVHCIFACGMIAAQMQAKQLWSAVAAQKVE